MYRVSVTSLKKWLNCPRAFQHYTLEKLRFTEQTAAEADPRKRGTYFHDVLEQAFDLPVGERLTHTLDAVSWHDKMTKCVKDIPAEFWQVERPISEDKMEVVYEVAGEEVMVVGKPDRWWVDVESETLMIDEFKTGGKSKSDAQRKLTNYTYNDPQVLWYAALIQDKYPDTFGRLFMERRHHFFSLNGFSLTGPVMAIPQWAIDRGRSDMLDTVALTTVGIYPKSEGPLCNWCDYLPLCQGEMMGQNSALIKADRFKVDTKIKS